MRKLPLDRSHDKDDEDGRGVQIIEGRPPLREGRSSSTSNERATIAESMAAYAALDHAFRCIWIEKSLESGWPRESGTTSRSRIDRPRSRDVGQGARHSGMEHALTTHRRILATWSAFLPWLQERELIASGKAPYLEKVVELPYTEPARTATRSSPDPVADIIIAGQGAGMRGRSAIGLSSASLWRPISPSPRPPFSMLAMSRSLEAAPC